MRRPILILAVLMLAAAGFANAQGYPNRPIRFVVPFTPGGSNDVLARAIGQKLQEMWNQPVVVENRTGAGGNIGTDMVAKSAADGYTWLLAPNNVLTVNPHLSRVPFDAIKDFTPVIIVATIPVIMVVNPALPVHSVRELIDLAKSKPGKLNYGSSGVGAPQHLAAELLKSMAGIDLVHVPYKGAAQALPDLLAGQFQVWIGAANTLLPLIKADKLRALAVAGSARYSALPDLPTVAETVPGYDVEIWAGIVMAAGVPAEVVNKVNADVARIMAMADIKEKLAQQGIDVTTSTPQKMASVIRAEFASWGKIIKDAGIKGE